MNVCWQTLPKGLNSWVRIITIVLPLIQFEDETIVLPQTNEAIVLITFLRT